MSSAKSEEQHVGRYVVYWGENNNIRDVRIRGEMQQILCERQNRTLSQVGPSWEVVFYVSKAPLRKRR